MTEAEILIVLANAQTALNECLTTKKPSYKVGEYSVNWAQYHRVLTDIIMKMEGLLNTLPSEEITLWRAAR